MQKAVKIIRELDTASKEKPKGFERLKMNFRSLQLATQHLFNNFKVLLDIGVYTKDYRKRSGSRHFGHQTGHGGLLNLIKTLESEPRTASTKGHLDYKKIIENLELMHDSEYEIEKAMLTTSNLFYAALFTNRGLHFQIFPILYKCIDKQKKLKMEKVSPKEKTFMDFVLEKREKREGITSGEAIEFIEPILYLHLLDPDYIISLFPEEIQKKFPQPLESYYCGKINEQYKKPLVYFFNIEKGIEKGKIEVDMSLSFELEKKLVKKYFSRSDILTSLILTDGYPWHFTRKRLIDAGGVRIGPPALHMGCAFGFYEPYLHYKGAEKVMESVCSYYNSFINDAFRDKDSKVKARPFTLQEFYFGSFFGNLRIAASTASSIVLKAFSEETPDEGYILEKSKIIHFALFVINHQLKFLGKSDEDAENLRKEYEKFGFFEGAKELFGDIE